MLFSQRKGYRPINEVIQVESMSDDLRNSLWNVLDAWVWSRIEPRDRYGKSAYINRFARSLWSNFFKKPTDEVPYDSNDTLQEIRRYFFNAKWHEVYDFVEFSVSYYSDFKGIPSAINKILEREMAGYRLVSGKITDITSKEEVEMLENSINDENYAAASAHIRRSLELLSDRKNPDYRNSIKESISAVESIAKSITGNHAATLGDALAEIEKRGKIHPALKKGFSSLYGYTSDEGGIRHAMLDEPNLTAADAKYFLMSCTSFVNYLKTPQ